MPVQQPGLSLQLVHERLNKLRKEIEDLSALTIDASQIVSGTIDTDRLGTGTANSSTFLRGDQQWASPPAVDLSSVWPVGSIFMSAVSTNPATLLGFGTWTAFGAGRVPVGYNAADSDFNASEKTGGAKTHTLTINEMPVHSHGVNDPGHFHRVSVLTSVAGAGVGGGAGDVGSQPTTTQDITGITIQNAGGGAAHNNLQPYIVVHMWKRIA